MNLKNTLTVGQIDLLRELFDRGSLDSLKHCVRDIDALDYFQTAAIAYALIAERCLLNIDTGLGKTLIAAGIMNVASTISSSLKWIYICQCSNLRTTAEKLKRCLYNKNLVYCDSTEEAILDTFFTLKCRNADVLVLSYEAVVQPSVEQFLFTNRASFKGIFLDESQMLSNLTSHTSRLVSAIINSCRYRILLSATPLRISVEQVINQIYMIDRAMFEDVNMQTFLNQFRVWSDRAIIGYRNLEYLQGMLMPRMLSISRSELQMRGNYTPMLYTCASALPDTACITEVINYKMLTTSSTMIRLVALIAEYKKAGKRGIIYANRNILKQALYDGLKKAGFSVSIMDGSTTNTQKKKSEVHQKFLNKELEVLITNITTGKDLPCDYIIFYELTFDYKQMVGRGERGLSGSDLDIVFVLTDSLYEMRFFYANVYQRGLLLEKLCGKEMPELHEAVKQLESKLKAKGLDLTELIQD